MRHMELRQATSMSAGTAFSEVISAVVLSDGGRCSLARAQRASTCALVLADEFALAGVHGLLRFALAGFTFGHHLCIGRQRPRQWRPVDC